MKHSFVMGLVSSSLTVIGFSVLASSLSPAKAASFTFDQSKLNLYGGSTPVNFNIDLDDTAAGEGKVQFKVNVAQGFFADLRGLFFHVKDESLLGGLNVSGKDLTQVVKSANSVVDLGGGNNLNGDGKGKNAGAIAGGFDVGVEIGTQGIGKDDIRSTSFVVSHATKKLSLNDFADQLFGIRLMSVGADRAGSSKFTGSMPALPPVQPPVVSNPEPPKTPAPPVVSNPEPPKPPVTNPEPPVASNPEPPKPPVVNNPAPPKPVLPPVAIDPTPPKPEEPVEVPEPSTVFLALASVGALKLLKRKQTTPA